MSKLSREKGKRYERDVARRYREIFGQDVRRGWQCRKGDDECDVVNCGPFAVEAKHRKSVSVWAAMEQAAENAKAGQIPVCHIKRHGGMEVVVLLAEDWFDLIREWKERGE